MKTTVKKWGNSLALRIPKAISEDLDISSLDRQRIRLIRFW